MSQRLVLFIPVLFLSLLTHAQFKKGDRMVGASVGTVFFNNGSTDFTTALGTTVSTNNDFGISFNPALGWFINENVAIGIMPDISFNKQKQVGKSSNGSTYLKNESNQFNIGIGGFARYYFKGKSESTRFFGQYQLLVGLGGTKTEGFQYETLGAYVDRYDRKSSGDFFAKTGLSLGMSRFLSSRTALDVYVGYMFSYNKSNPTGTSLRDFADPGTPDETQKVNYDQKFTGNNVMLGVGFQVFLDKKK